MAEDATSRGLGTGDFITIAATVLGIVAIVTPLDWILRSILIAVAIGLVVFAALRHSAHPLVRGAVATVVVTGLILASWRPVWEDFHAKYPLVEPQIAILYAAISGVVIASVVLFYKLVNRAPTEGRRLDPFLLLALAGGIFVVIGLGGFFLRSGFEPTAIAVPPTAIDKPVQPQKPRYTRVALEQRQLALSELSATVEGIAKDFDTAKSPIFDNWPKTLPGMGLKAYAAAVLTLRDQMEAAKNDVQSMINKQGYDDIRKLPAWQMPQVRVPLTIWAETVQGIPEDQKDNRPFGQKAAWNLYVQTIDQITGWIDGMRGAIAAKRAKYDSADVYQ
jgi:hypothetical protein